MVVLPLLLPPALVPPDEEQPAAARASTIPQADASRHRALRLDGLATVGACIIASRLCEWLREMAGAAYPLTDPTVRPAAIYRWAAMSMMAAGRMAKTASAMAAPRFEEKTPM